MAHDGASPNPSAQDPATPGLNFGVYDEGAGVYSLYVASARASRVLEALAPLAAEGRVAVFSEHPIPEGATPMASGGWFGPPELLETLSGSAEVLILDQRGPDLSALRNELPGSLLAHPDKALPAALGAVAALHMEPDGHVVVLARAPEILMDCLRPLVEDTLRDALGRSLDVEDAQLAELLAPLEASGWRSVTAESTRRYHRVRVGTHEFGSPSDEQSWVAPLNGERWTANWSW